MVEEDEKCLPSKGLKLPLDRGEAAAVADLRIAAMSVTPSKRDD
jgi:hypothetical protein